MIYFILLAPIGFTLAFFVLGYYFTSKGSAYRKHIDLYRPARIDEFESVVVKSHDGMKYKVIKTKYWLPKNPTILFYHGFPDNPHSWVDQLRFFSQKGFNAVAPPLRGYQPTYIPKDHVIDDQGKDILYLIE
jgi:pimeloyl-ACP methyl ester carboxylesterase